MNRISGIVPRRILTGSIRWVAPFGEAGSAAFLFMAAALAQNVSRFGITKGGTGEDLVLYGINVLQPLLIGMLSTLTIVWAMVPSVPQRHGD
ncbi:hypothetical protein OPQ81_009662 [Rhizoctonia solani]|nr:hypothetical protein OPQ81_009662 [Rhizoctonia solani]